MEVSGSGSIPLTSESGSGRPKNMWIRIRNTGCFGLLRNRSVCFGCFDIGSKHRNKPKFFVFGFTKQTEIYFCLFRGHLSWRSISYINEPEPGALVPNLAKRLTTQKLAISSWCPMKSAISSLFICYCHMCPPQPTTGKLNLSNIYLIWLGRQSPNLFNGGLWLFCFPNNSSIIVQVLPRNVQ
jgi:hypothetical protein